MYVDVVAGIPLPNLVGQNIGTIQGWAGSNNIQLNVVQVASSQPQGIIVRQSPDQGTPVAPGQTTVTVYVSNGPPEVRSGNLTGQPFQQVQQELQQLGFQVDGRAFGPGQKVFAGDPVGAGAVGQHDHRVLRRVLSVSCCGRGTVLYSACHAYAVLVLVW